MSSDLSVIDADWNVEDGQVETAPLSNGSNGELSNTVILSIVVSCMAVFMVLTAVILHAQGFFRRVDYAELQRKALTKRKRRQKELLTAKFGTGDPIEYVRREIEEAEEKFHAGEYAASLPLLSQIIHILEEHPATHKRAMTPGPNTADEKKLPSVDRLPYTYFHHGIVSLALFDFVAANKTAKRIIQLRPRWWQGYYLLCDSHCRMEEWHKALKAITFCFDLYVPDGDAEEVVRYYDYLQDKVQHVIERSAANTALNSAVNTATNTARSMVDDNDHDIELQEGI